MSPERMGALTDGVIAVILTIVVLELPVPHGAGMDALRRATPILLAYALSFVNVAIFWNNHHHMLQATGRVDGATLWANFFMLFWLSLVPWLIRWLDESGFAAVPTAAYGLVLALAAMGYWLTQTRIIRANGPGSAVERGVGRDVKGKASMAGYVIAVPLAFLHPWIADAIYVAIALVWLAPDRRMERVLREE